MSLKYVIRPMTEDDTFAVELIEQVIFSLPWSQKSFADACRNQDNVYLVCEADGVIAGYCGMWTVLGEGNITNMAVCLLYTSPSPRDMRRSRMPSSA